MKVSVFAYSKKGCETAKRIIGIMKDSGISAWCAARLLDDTAEGKALQEWFSPVPKDFRTLYGERFAASDAMIFVGACGIAVREVAPFVKSKKTDPAVICVDDHARFVIPVLSGHIGGANELAAKLAGELGALPVITTATDISGRFSVDTWAIENGLIIDNMKAAKDVSAAILERDIPFLSDLPVTKELPSGLYHYETVTDPEGSAKEPLGIYVTYKKERPFAETLRLIPKALILGIGCRKGIEKSTIRAAVDEVLKEYSIDPRSVKSAASIDIKKEEAGLLAWCEENHLPISFYSADELNTLSGSFTSSSFVKQTTGTDNICERAAMMNADRLIVRKTAQNGVTVAIGLSFPEKGTFPLSGKMDK